MNPTLRLTCARALLIALCAATAEAQEAGDSKITVEQLGGNVYALRSVGHDPGNIVVSAGEDGIVIVDDRDARSADKILAALNSLSIKPVRFVINTHVHGDHTGGNPVFRKLAPIIAHRNVRARMIGGGEKMPPEAWPTVTFDGEMNLYFNGEDIRLVKLPPGHTDGDVVISPAASFGDRSNGGSILALIDALKYVLPQIPADAKVVPSHGDISSRADVARGLEILMEMKAIVEAGIAAGKTKEQMVAEK